MPEKKGWAERLMPETHGYFWPTFYEDPYCLCISKYGKAENGTWKSEELMYHCGWCEGGGSVWVEKPVAELNAYCERKGLAVPRDWNKVVGVYRANNNWDSHGSGKVPTFHTVGRAHLIDLGNESVAGTFKIELLHKFVKENKPTLVANAGQKFEKYEVVPHSDFGHKPRIDFDETFDSKEAEHMLHHFDEMVPMAIRLRERCDAEEKRR